MAVSRKKIGIFAGSFDPVHNGHIAAARAAVKQLKLTAVYFVVEPRPRYKQGVKSFEHRSEMVRLAIEEDPKLKQIIIDEPHCTTEDTIPMLKNRFPQSELFLLMGDDVARRIADWSQTNILIESVHLAVFRRVMNTADIEEVFAKVGVISGRKLNYVLLENSPIECSSSVIKQQLKAGKVSDSCLDNKVLWYLKKHNIYGSSGLGS